MQTYEYQGVDAEIEKIFTDTKPAKAPDKKPARKKTVVGKLANFTTRKAKAQAHAVLLRDILVTLMHSIYEQTESGYYWNISEDGRIEKDNKLPWTNSGYSSWGVRRTHAKILQWKMNQAKGGPLYYDPIDTYWYLNTFDYPTVDDALQWVSKLKIDGETWLKMVDEWKEARPKTKPRTAPRTAPR